MIYSVGHPLNPLSHAFVLSNFLNLPKAGTVDIIGGHRT